MQKKIMQYLGICTLPVYVLFDCFTNEYIYHSCYRRKWHCFSLLKCLNSNNINRRKKLMRRKIREESEIKQEIRNIGTSKLKL